MLKLNPLEMTDKERLGLKILPAEQQSAWQICQQYSNPSARYNAYLNRLCANTFMTWAEDWMAEESLPKPSVWPSEEMVPSLWEVVNGTAIQWGNKRLAIVPTDEADTEEFFIPQEWVDNPHWMADYYLAAVVILDGDENQCWMQIRGFTTHRQLKNQGRYDRKSRTYSLAMKELTEDLNVMQITLGLHVREKVENLPILSEAEAQNLLEILGDSSVYFPRLRLDVPFEKWAALLTSHQWRQQLYGDRVGQVVKEVTAPSKPVDLKQWLQNMLEEGQNVVGEGWEGFEAFFTQLEPSVVRGQKKVQMGLTDAMDTDSSTAIAPVIRLLEPTQPKELRYQAAGVLGEIGIGNPDAIAALTRLLYTAEDEETRWQAALSLGKVDPGNPAAGVKKAKLIDLGMQLGNHAVALIVAIMPKADARLNVFLQVQPQNQSKLPPHLKLTVLSESGEPIPGLEVKARSDEKGEGKDNSIQQRFSPPPNTHFQVRVTLNDISVTEDFVA